MTLKTHMLHAAVVAALTVLAVPALAQQSKAPPQALEEKNAPGAGRASPGGQTAAAVQAPGTAETPGDDVERTFRGAFTDEMAPVERVRVLERLAKEHPDSKWAADALWVLGEAAREQGLPERVVYYWQYLMGSDPEVELQPFTRSQPIYLNSGLPPVSYYLSATGLGYAPHEGLAAKDGTYFYNAKPFNPAPMLVWDGLGHAYEDLGRTELALKAYKKALECAPTGGPWVSIYQGNVDRLKNTLELHGAALKAAGAHAGKDASPPPSGLPAAESGAPAEALASVPSARPPAQEIHAAGPAPKAGADRQ